MSRDFNAPKIRLPEDYFENLVKEVCATYKDGAGINLFDGFKLPHQQEIVQLIERLLEIVFPGYRVDSDYNPDTLCFSIGHQLQEIYYSLNHLVVSAMHFKNMVDNCKDCDVDERTPSQLSGRPLKKMFAPHTKAIRLHLIRTRSFSAIPASGRSLFSVSPMSSIPKRFRSYHG